MYLIQVSISVYIILVLFKTYLEHIKEQFSIQSLTTTTTKEKEKNESCSFCRIIILRFIELELLLV
jgi:hypothetical protein